MTVRNGTAARPLRSLPDPESWIWDWDGPLESVQDARDRTRGQAIARYCSDTCAHFPQVRAWKRHARSLTIAQQWDNHAERNWAGVGDPPSDPPDGWRPDPWDEGMPAWELCSSTDDGAIPVWIVAPAGVEPPRRQRAS